MNRDLRFLIIVAAWIVVFIAAISIAKCHAQTVQPSYKWYPHPYVEGDLSLNGAGYETVSVSPMVGWQWETRRFSFLSSVSYDTARKSNDGTLNNNNGHSRGIGGNLYYKLNENWAFGGGIGWGQTSTTNYEKQSADWYAGGQKDWFIKNFSYRIGAEYLRHFNERTNYPGLTTFTSPGGGSTYLGHGCKCTNGVQGITVDFWMPSPATNHKVFFHEVLTPIFFHSTVTDPYDLPLTVAEERNRSHSAFLSIGIIYRF